MDGVIREIQENLADATDLSLALLDRHAFHVATESGSCTYDAMVQDVCPARIWSNPEPYVPLLNSQAQGFMRSYIGWIRRKADQVDSRVEAHGDWGPLVFKSPLGVYQFLVPIGRRTTEGADPEHIAYLLGGSVWYQENGIASPRPSTAHMSCIDQELARFKDDCGAELPSEIKHQVVCEVLGSPAWPREFFSEVAENLGVALSEVMSTHYRASATKDAGFDYRSAAVELLRSVERRGQFADWARKLVEELEGTVDALVLVIRHPETGSAFSMTWLAAHDRATFRLLPKPQDYEACGVEKLAQLSPRTLEAMVIGFTPSWGRRFPIPGSPDTHRHLGYLWLFKRRRNIFARHTWNARRRLIQAYVNALSANVAQRNDHIKLSIFHTERRNVTNQRHLLSQLMTGEAFKFGVDMEQVLRTVSPVVGFKAAAYYRLRLYADPPVAALYRHTPKEMEFDKTISIRDKRGKELVAQMRPVFHDTEAFFPVIHGGRVLGIVDMRFDSATDLDRSIPFMLEFVNRLTARVPYHRGLERSGQIATEVQELGKPGAVEDRIFNNIAGCIASLLGESACSIWIDDRTTPSLRRVGGAGFTPSVSRFSRADRTLVSAISEADPLVLKTVDLTSEAAKDSVRLRDELLSKGFLQGAGMCAVSDDIVGIVLVWSRSSGRFTDEDQALLQLPVSILSRVYGLLKLSRDIETQLDETFVDVGHELNNPLTGVVGAIDSVVNGVGMTVQEQRTYLTDIAALVQYTQALTNNMTLLSQIQNTRYIAPPRTDLGPCNLGTDIIPKMERVLRVEFRNKGLRLESAMDTIRFPVELQLTSFERTAVEGILFNLLANAAKFTPRGSINPILIIGERTRTDLVVRVQNFGIGVPHGEEKQIFLKRKRGSNAEQGQPPTGTGFGLYIGRRLAHLIGGDLTLVRNDKPTEFQLSLPLDLAR